MRKVNKTNNLIELDRFSTIYSLNFMIQLDHRSIKFYSYFTKIIVDIVLVVDLFFFKEKK